MFGISLFPLNSTFCLNLIIPNITPGGLFSGVLIHGRSFPFQKMVPKRPGAYTRWGLLSEFYGISLAKCRSSVGWGHFVVNEEKNLYYFSNFSS